MSAETMPHGRAAGKPNYEPGDAEQRKHALAAALDSCCNVIVETRELMRDTSMPWTPGERQMIAVGLEGLARVCNSVARECERTGPEGLPPGLKEITDEGRREEIDCIFAAQRINEVNDDVRGQITETITFRHTDPLPLRWLAERGFDPDQVKALPAPGGWIAIDDNGKVTTNARFHAPRKTSRDPAAQR